MKKIHRTAIAVLAAAAIVCAAVIGRSALETEQTNAEATADPEPLVINTVEDGDDMILTVIREDETVYQYEGDVKIWRGTDGKNYAILHLNEEVLQ